MRRTLSILFTLVLALGSVWNTASVLSSGSFNGPRSGWTGKADESRLPACCRRSGVHHCSMDVPSGETAVTPVGCCPCLPRALATAATPFASLIGFGRSLPTLVEYRSSLPFHLAVSLPTLHTRPKRGPPSLQIL